MRNAIILIYSMMFVDVTVRALLLVHMNHDTLA